MTVSAVIGMQTTAALIPPGANDSCLPALVPVFHTEWSTLLGHWTSLRGRCRIACSESYNPCQGRRTRGWRHGAMARRSAG